MDVIGLTMMWTGGATFVARRRYSVVPETTSRKTMPATTATVHRFQRAGLGGGTADGRGSSAITRLSGGGSMRYRKTGAYPPFGTSMITGSFAPVDA